MDLYIEFLVVLVFIPITIFLFKNPEIALALFTYAYVLKGGLNYGPKGIINFTVIFLIIAAIGFFLPVIFKRKKVKFKIEISDLIIFLFLIIMLFGDLITKYSEYGLERTFRFSITVFIPYLFTRIFMTDINKVRKFIITILLISLFVGTTILIIPQTFFRATFFSANAIPVGILISTGIIISFIILLEKDFLKRNNIPFILLILIALPILVYSLFSNGSRGPGISMFISLSCYLALSIKKSSLKGLTALLVIIFIVIIISFNAITIPNIHYYELLTKENKGESINTRFELYSKSIEYFNENPLFGLGTGGFLGKEGTNPHNLLLQIVTENGIIGLLIFIVFIYTILLNIKFYIRKFETNSQTNKSIGYIIIFVTISLFIEAQFSLAIDQVKDLFIFFALILNLSNILK